MEMVSGAATYQIGFYTTTGEASAYGAYGMAEVDGTTCYYGLGTGVDVAHGSEVKTPLKVNKSGTDYYMLIKGNAELASYNLTLAATSNQTITLKYKNRNSTNSGYETEVTKTSTGSAQSFSVRNGTTWTASIASATGWTAGSLSPGASGTVSAAVTVSASAATYKTFTLTLAATSNQTITLKYKNKKSDGSFEAEVTKTSTGSAQNFTVGYGTTWTATVAGATGWTAGALSPGASGTVTAAVTVSAAAATYKTFALKLNAMNTNQTITLKYKNKKSDGTFDSEVSKTSTGSAQTFTVGYGTTWTASVSPSTGWNAGALSPGASGTVTAAVTVSCAAATYKTFTLTKSATNASTNQTLTVQYQNKASNGTFGTKTTLSSGSVTLGYGSHWWGTVSGVTTGWNAGKITNPGGDSSSMTSNVTVSIAAATYKSFTLTKSATNASTNQTLTVQYQNKASSGSFGTKTTLSSGSASLGYGSHWWGTVSGVTTGWNAGKITNPGGDSSSMTSNVTVSIAAATYKSFTLTKSATNASTNQTLTVQYQNKASSGSFGTKTTLSSGSASLGYGSHWWGTVSPSTGWNAGAVTNPGGDSSSLTSNITVSVAAATHKNLTLTLAATSNQTITLKYKNYSGTAFASEVTKTSTSSAQSFTVGYGTTWTATVAGATYYTAGKLSPGASGTVTANTTVNAAAATWTQTYTLTLAATSNQTITLKYKNRNSANSGYEAEVTKTSTGSAQNFTVRRGTTWTATIAAASGYKAGTLSASSGTVTAATTVSASAATVNEAIIMGIVLTQEGGGEGTWVRVDKNYNTIAFNANHKTWKNIKEVTDATYGKFIEIPISYVKTEKIASGKYAGKYCWWIADGPVSGYHVHPAFMGSDGKAHNLQIGVGLTYNNNGTPNSYYQGTAWNIISYNEVHAKGWMSGNVRPYSIYDHSLLLRMMLIEFGTSQAIYKRISDSPDYGGSEIRFYIYGEQTYHGINDAFASYKNYLILDGITSLNGTFQILKPNGSRQMVETGVSCPSTWYKWPITCKINTANGINFGDLFIGDRLGEENEASFPDVQDFESDKCFTVCGSNEYDSYGPFNLEYYDLDRQANFLYWRISKMAS